MNHLLQGESNDMDTHTLSICSGYGGIELGLRQVIPRIRNVCYVENEITQAKILASRIKEGRLDDAPIWSDLRSFNAKPFRGKVDILTGGFPCQPHSVAGKRQAESDPRELSGEVLRIANELGKPTLFLENVPGIKRFYWDNIRPKLQAMGYRTEEILVTARETGAPHKRQRIFILANAGTPRLDGWYDAMEDSIRSRARGWSERLQQESGAWGTDSTTETEGSGSELADSVSGGTQESDARGHSDTALPIYPPRPDDNEGWAHVLTKMQTLEPAFCRVANGFTPWVDERLRSIGNGVVPAMASTAWIYLIKRFG